MRTESITVGDKSLTRIALLWAYPVLRKLPPSEWDEVLKQAKKAEFDMIERIWILAGIALVTYLLRFDASQAAALSLPIRYLTQFLAAVPLIILIVGPVYLRCMRRGLDREIERQHRSGQFDPHRRCVHDKES
jgi:hypothetical protein